LAADSMKQLYSVVARVRTAAGYPPYASCNVCPLNEDGRRAILMSGLESEEAALYIEEILEVELGVFGLPVYGDVGGLARAWHARLPVRPATRTGARLARPCRVPKMWAG
jgi:hypothetical protein